MTTPCSFARIALLALLAIGHASPAGSSASPMNPTLFAEDDGIDVASKRRELRLASLTIDVSIEGSIAATTLTAAFAGIPDETVEGHFSLALPQGAIVNGYALDIDDQMIQGVLIPRPKARDAYDSKVRQGIDPGFAEVTGANVFATTVYPIEEGIGRKIRVQFVSPLHRGLSLPLVTDASIDSIDIHVRAREVTAPPRIELPSGLVAPWHRTRDGFTASIAARDLSLHGSLAIAAVAPRRPALISRDQAGQAFFQIRDVFPDEQHTLRPQRIRVYWDHSLSRRDDALDREIELLERYVRFAGTPVDLVTFNSSGARIVSVDSVDRLRHELDGLVYRGGTSVAVLDALRLPEADACLLFSDGNATIDRRDTFAPDCPLKAITSAADADRGYLAQLTRAFGGVVIRLGSDSPEHAYQRLVRQAPIVAGASDDNGRPLQFAVIDNGREGFFVVGEGPRSGEIILHFKGAHGRAFQQRYSPRRRYGQPFGGAAALWAADQIARLASADHRFDELERLARRYSIPSPTLAFVVLETPEDYAWADLPLPKDYPAAAREAYTEAKAEHDARLIEDREAHVRALRKAWHEQKAWWSTQFDPRARPERNRRARAQPDGLDADLSEIIVTARRREDVLLNSPIEILPWHADRPYLRALEQAAPGDIDRALAAQAQEHGHLPAFYLDTAEWLYQRDQVNEAGEMLLSALELPLCNEETRAIVAERLLRYGYFDRSIALYEQAARLASHRPQPKMQLALALAQRAAVRTQSAKRDLRRAIQLLNDVAMTPWNGAYDGIALIALMEANALIPRLNRLGGARVALAPELIALLDLDIRVVIQWNTAATDLDLWVDEPNGERAIYSNRFTAIGGRLSNDMTDGYGPEEYLLRKAAPGEYRVNIDVFATDAINPNGATTVTARLIHDFGRPSEHEESVDVELLPDETGERLVGRIFVGGAE